MNAQASLFDELNAGLCCYGDGPGSRCRRPATHRACWQIPAAYLDGTPCRRAGSGSLDCCRDHADYYASAWFPTFPYMVDVCWIDVLVATG